MRSEPISAEQPRYNVPFDDAKLTDFMWNCWRRADAFCKPVLDEAKKLYATYAGQALLERDQTYVKETFRLPIDLPLAKGVLDTVVGIAMAQGLEPTWKGVEQQGLDDDVKGDWLSQLVKQCRTRCNAHRKERGAFFDKCVTGYGFNDNFIDLTKVPIRPVTDMIEIDCVRWDPEAREDNLSDGKFWIRFYDWSVEEAESRWPEKKDEISAGIAAGTIWSHTPNTSGTQARRSSMYAPTNRVRVYDFQYCRWETRVIYFDPESGERMECSLAQFKTKQREQQDIAKAQVSAHAIAVEEARENGMPEPQPPTLAPEIEEAYNHPGAVWYRAYLLGNAQTRKGVVLSHEPISINRPTITCDTGFKWKDPDNGTTRFFGLMRVIYDAQLYLNRAMSEYLDIMARGVKGGGFIPEGALGKNKSVAEFIKDCAKPGYWHVVKDGYEGKIVPMPAQLPPSGFEAIFRMMVEMFGRLTGVTEFLQGTNTSDRANVLVSNMQEQGIQMLSPIFEPHKALITDNGRATAAIALKHLPAQELDRILGKQEVPGITHEPDPMTGQMMPIVGEDGQPVTPGKILKEVDVLDYDVTVDVAVATPTQRAAAWEFWANQGMLSTFLGADEGVAGILLPEIVEVAPMPAVRAKKVADDLRKLFEKKEKQGTEDGVLQGFTEVLQSDPQSAGQLLQQLAQQLAQVQQQQPPQGAPPEQAM